jgi:hypothetical protein
MRVIRRVFLIVVTSLMLGAGCGAAQDVSTPLRNADTDPSALDLPGVPYGTGKKALNDLEKAQQLELQRQQNIP